MNHQYFGKAHNPREESVTGIIITSVSAVVFVVSIIAINGFLF